MYLGIDVGGTTIKAALIGDDASVGRRTTIRTGTMTSREAVGPVVDALVDLVGRNDIASCGLAVPGVVNARGELVMAPNIDLDLPLLVEGLKAALDVPVVCVNDANAAALGELWGGSGKAYDSVVFLTLGTGVGAGVVVDGKLVVGRGGMTGECGHINVVEEGGRLCGCGRTGCLESYASAPGLVKTYLELCEAHGVEPVALEHAGHALPVIEAARAGDPVAVEAVGSMAKMLGRAMAAIAVVLGPEAFILGGGVSGGFDVFEAPLLEAYRTYVIPAGADIPVVVAELGNDAGIVGAAYFAKSM
jgi:glucokinase